MERRFSLVRLHRCGAIIGAAVAVACVGCGHSASSGQGGRTSSRVTNSGSARGRATGEATRPDAGTGASQICRTITLRSGAHTYTTPGSFTEGRPGSCARADLLAVVELATRLRQAGRSGGNVCDLLGPDYRRNAERWAIQGHLTCSEAVIKYAGNATNARVQLAQPLSQILLVSYTTTPSSVSAFVTFASRVKSAGRSAGRPLTVRASKDPSGKWVIDQIGYEF
jgi:hypothetical protein